MRPEEFAALARVEERHWFYSGKREIARRWLARLGALGHDRLVVDVGAGTGLFAAELRHRCRVVAVDPDPTALAFIRSRAAPGESLPTVAASADALPLATASVDGLTALDVLEHLDDDRAAMGEFVRVVRPGGGLVISVPAFPALWSDWDVSLHHRRRYTRVRLARVLRGLPVEVRHFGYVNTFAFAPILAYRLARRLELGGSARLEDGVPGEPLNTLLRRLFVEPAMLPISFPVGVSLLCALRRTGAP